MYITQINIPRNKLPMHEKASTKNFSLTRWPSTQNNKNILSKNINKIIKNVTF